jgi:hypothetical protein
MNHSARLRVQQAPEGREDQHAACRECCRKPQAPLYESLEAADRKQLTHFFVLSSPFASKHITDMDEFCKALSIFEKTN